MYSYTSEAIELEYENDANLTEVKKHKTLDELWNERKGVLQRKAIKTLAIIAAILAVVMIREARIDQLCGQVTKLNDEIHEYNSMITEREMSLSCQLDMNNIDYIAVSRLGMKKPDSSQYIQINVEKQNGGEVLTKDSAGSDGFSAFVNKAKILLEYLN